MKTVTLPIKPKYNLKFKADEIIELYDKDNNGTSYEFHIYCTDHNIWVATADVNEINDSGYYSHKSTVYVFKTVDELKDYIKNNTESELREMILNLIEIYEDRDDNTTRKS